MKFVLPVLALVLTSACMGGGGSGVSTSTSSSSSSAVQASLSAVDASSDQGFAGMLNNVRSTNGAGAVSYDSRLGVAAQRHADDMLQNGFFSHTGSDGSSVGDRARDAGYNWWIVGENIARGHRSEEEVLRAWVNSPDHQENNIDPRFEDFALEQAGSGSSRHWVLVFGSER